MNYQTLNFTIDNGTGHIKLNNPPGNPMSLQFFNELHHVCTHRINEPSIKGVVISSTGRHFSEGAVVSELYEATQSMQGNHVPEQMKKNAESLLLIRKLNKPVVALLKGICYGSGFELALAAHYRIAAHNTLLCFPEVSFGIMPGLGGIHSVFEQTGMARSIELVLSGRTIDSKEAQKLGIIDLLVSKEELLLKGMELIESKSRNSGLVLQEKKL